MEKILLELLLTVSQVQEVRFWKSTSTEQSHRNFQFGSCETTQKRLFDAYNENFGAEDFLLYVRNCTQIRKSHHEGIFLPVPNRSAQAT